MYNWSVDTTELKKDKEQYTIWRLEQLLNYGLAGAKLDRALIKKYWGKLSLDPLTRDYLDFLLWPKKARS